MENSTPLMWLRPKILRLHTEWSNAKLRECDTSQFMVWDTGSGDIDIFVCQGWHTKCQPCVHNQIIIGFDSARSSCSAECYPVIVYTDVYPRHKPWWRHRMETFSTLLALCVRGIHRPPMNSPHKGQWCGALMFPLICVWINGWVNNHEAGDLRRHRAHYDVNVMFWLNWHRLAQRYTISRHIE